MKFKKTNSDNKDFCKLIESLDVYLTTVNGDKDDFFRQFNGLDTIKHVIVVYDNDEAIGCGAIKKYNAQTVEIKRMYVIPAYRRKEIAKKILLSLENWARELSYTTCILETSIRMESAKKLYRKNGYVEIAKYGPYSKEDDSICFEKIID